ncbi:MAG: acyltransferase, partial [Rikenellaceae bacterium]|nr:acyltransferase [Rikenellaceae bacterium]
DMIGIGWTLDAVNFFGGLLRMLFPFTVGMLLARNFKPVKVKGIFWIAWAVLFGLFSLPAFAKCGTVSINGLYEVACVVLIFPAIVWLVASGETTSKVSAHVCKFLGDISYPLYIVHYPVMYLFYAWLIKNELYSLGATWEVVIMVFAINVTLAYACLKLYDEPVRRWLTRRFIKTKSEEQQK